MQTIKDSYSVVVERRGWCWALESLAWTFTRGLKKICVTMMKIAGKDLKNSTISVCYIGLLYLLPVAIAEAKMHCLQSALEDDK